MHKIYRYSYFYDGESNCVCLFPVELPNSPENRVKNEQMNQFSDESAEKVACEKSYLLKLEFYNTDRKMKKIIRHIFTSLITHPIFMHFHQKSSFKSALESFASASGHLRTALKS